MAKNKPLFDDELDLISVEIIKDTIGQEIGSEEVLLHRLCSKKSISRSEYYQAKTSKLSPSVIFIVKKFEYDEQREIEYQNNRYRVIKTYSDTIEDIELTCERIEYEKNNS